MVRKDGLMGYGGNWGGGVGGWVIFNSEDWSAGVDLYSVTLDNWH